MPTLPVYNYDAILEVRRLEKEARKQVREERKREKERRKVERAKRRADKILGRKLLTRRTDAEHKKPEQLKKQPTEVVSVSDVLASLEDDKTESEKKMKEDLKEEEKSNPAGAPKEKLANEGEEEEEAEEEDEHEGEDDEEEEGDEEEEEEEEEDEDKQSSRLTQSDNVATAAESEEAVQPEVEAREWPSLPAAPLKGILVCPGFG